MNYGGIGSVMSHELSHSLDTISMLYDENIITREWLDEESIHNISERRRCFVDQYNGYGVDDYYVS